VRLTDLGSKNGTHLGETRIGEVWLSDALVRLGDTTLRIQPAREHVSKPLARASGFGQVVGASTEMRRLYPLCERLAQLDVPVLIEGETGTGKEVLAEALHAEGPRREQPYVVFDCTAVPPSMVEAALFGHERGSFTGAVASRAGVFERAQGGTLLIDEIGDLDLALQPKLLRVVERGEVQRIGGERTIRVNVRLLAATRRNLDQEIQAGRFRDDLFHRLAVARVELPPLRNRRGDVPRLVKHFCDQLGFDVRQIPPAKMQSWQDTSWPGNIRELKNAVSRHVMLGDLVEDGSLPFDLGVEPSADSFDWLERVMDADVPLVQARKRVVEEFERRYIERVLAAHGGSVKEAAKAAGVAKRYFQLLRARLASRD
jgi:two-component system, NtrC family, response regulator HydG